MDIEQYLQEIIDTCKKHLETGEWTKNDAIRYAYVNLGKKLSKSTRFFYSLEKKYGDCGLSVEEMKKIHYADSSYEVTCYVSAKMLKKVFSELGIEAQILQSAVSRPYIMNGETLNIFHSYLVCTGDDDKKYFLSPNSDLVNLKYNFKTEHFANDVPYKLGKEQTYQGEEIKHSTLSDAEIYKIDKKIGYLIPVYDNSQNEPVYVYANDDPNHDIYGKQRKSTDDYLMLNIEKLDNGFLTNLNRIFNTFRNSKGQPVSRFSELTPNQKRIVQTYVLNRSIERVRTYMNIPESNPIIAEELNKLSKETPLNIKEIQNAFKKLIVTNMENHEFLTENKQTNPFIIMSTAISLMSTMDSFPDLSKKVELTQSQKDTLFFRYQDSKKKLAKLFVDPAVVYEYTANKNPSNYFIFSKIRDCFSKDFECEDSKISNYLPNFCTKFGVVEQASYIKKYLRTILKQELPEEKDFSDRILYSTLSEINDKDSFAFLIFVKKADDILNESTYALIYNPKTNQINETNFMKVRTKYKILSKTIMNQLNGTKPDQTEEESSSLGLDEILNITDDLSSGLGLDNGSQPGEE